MISVPDLQQALLEVLSDHFDAAEQVVDFGLPAKVPRKRERFYVLDEIDYRAARQSAFATETYTLQLQVEVKTVKKTAKETSDRRWALIREVDALLRTGSFKRHLASDDGIVSARSTHVPFESGFIAVSLVGISVKARG